LIGVICFDCFIVRSS